MTYTYSHHGTEKNSQYLDASPLHPREGKIDQSKSNQKNKLPAVVLVDIWPNNEVKSKGASSDVARCLFIAPVLLTVIPWALT